MSVVLKSDAVRLRRTSAWGMVGAAALLVLFLVPVQAISTDDRVTQSSPEILGGGELGLPAIRNFSAREYGEASQNWAVAQGQDGLMYFGNNHGVMEFDGTRWRLIPVANRTAARDLAVADNGRIYVSAQREFGYLEPDDKGRMQYHSLSEKLPEELRDFQDVWSTAIHPEGVYFSSFDRVFLWDGEDFSYWEPETSFHRAYSVGGRFFIRERGRGLMEMVDGEFRLLPGSERFADERVDLILDGSHIAGNDFEIVVGTRAEGFTGFDGDEWKHWETDVTEAMGEDRLYGGTTLPDGRIALGTTQAGVHIIDSEGRYVSQLDREAGLQDDIVYDLGVDHHGGLWMALDGGIARAGMDASLTRYDGRRGLPGRVNALERHEGYLYASTNQGLYVLEPGQPTRFSHIPEIAPQAWDFQVFEDELLVASNDGLFSIKGDRVEDVRLSERTSFSVFASEVFPGRVYIGLSNGLAVVQRTEDGWEDLGRVADIDNQVRTMEESPEGQLWLGTAHTGLVRIEFEDSDSLEPVRVDRYSGEHGLPGMRRNFVYQVSDETVFATRYGLKKFNEEEQRFDPHPQFRELFSEAPRRLMRLEEDASGRIWMHARDEATGEQETGAAIPDGDGGYYWESRPLRGLRGIYTYAIHADTRGEPGDEGIMWLGGDEGLFRYEPGMGADEERSLQALIRRVSIPGDEPMYQGAGSPPSAEIEYADNRLRFEYAATNYDGTEETRFQVKLEGQDTEWSDWTEDTAQTRGNLWEGDYRFRVRARDLYDTISEEAVYEFTVMPPWYRTMGAYVVFGLLFVTGGWGLMQLYFRRLAFRNRRLQRLVRNRTRELESAKGRAERALERLRSTQQELIEAEKMATVGRLVAGIAHEINTPVGNGQVTATSLAERTHDMADKIEKNGALSRRALTEFLADCQRGMQLMTTSFERIGALVGRLHRVTSQPYDQVAEWYEVSDLLQDIKLSRRQSVAEKGIEIHAEASPRLSIKGNRVALSECLNELIDNSVDHGFPEVTEGAEIRIEAVEEDGTVRIDYRDNGRGLDPQVRQAIFEPFAAGMQNEPQHTGLGTHTVFNIVRRVLGGNIECHTPDRGVHFVIRLPREPEGVN